MSNRVKITAAFFVFALLPRTMVLYAAPPFSDTFDRANGLLTNEFAYWNPSVSGIRLSPDWDVESGSLFVQGNAGWTGVPDAIEPNLLSTNGTNSSIFRMVSRRGDFQNVGVSFSLLNQGLVSNAVTPAVDWDGCHMWLRYQSETHLYYASINRRDHTVVIKKKIPGGSSNGGTYYDLSPFVQYNVPYNTWQNVRATIDTLADGSVDIRLYINGTLLVSAIDNGSIAGPPITAAGHVGIRGDNANLKFDNFSVSDLVPAIPPPPPPASSACDVNTSGAVNVSDVQLCANQAMGLAGCTNGDINDDNVCNVIDIQRIVNAILNGICVTR